MANTGDWDLGGIFLAATAGLLAVAAVTVPLVCVGKAIATDGHVQHCYVETYTYHVPTQANVVIYDLVGFRAWRSDRRMAQNLRSLEEVQKAAQQLNCVIK